MTDPNVAPTGEPVPLPCPLTFGEVARVNLARCLRWHPGGIEDWSVADWGCAMGGEAGEVLNAIKKLRRVEEQIASNNEDQPENRERALAAIGLEIGDTCVYLDLLAQRLGLSLEACVSETFNRVSEREGFPERLGNTRAALPQEEPQPRKQVALEEIGRAKMEAVIGTRWDEAAALRETERVFERQGFVQHCTCIQWGRGGEFHTDRESCPIHGKEQPVTVTTASSPGEPAPLSAEPSELAKLVAWLAGLAAKEEASASARAESARVWRSGDEQTWEEGRKLARVQTRIPMLRIAARDREQNAVADERIAEDHTRAASRYRTATALLARLSAAEQRLQKAEAFQEGVQMMVCGGEPTVEAMKELGQFAGLLNAKAALQQRVTELEARLMAARDRADWAESERDRLREALEKYGEHTAACSIRVGSWSPGDPVPTCDCGLSALLTSLTESEPSGEKGDVP